MNLIPWHSKRSGGGELAPSLHDIRREMARAFNRFFEDSLWAGEPDLMGLAPSMGQLGEFMPAVDVSEDDKSVTVRAEIPGVEPDKVNVELVGNTLTISGQKEESREDRGKDYYRSERSFGSFMRRIPLPESADPDRVTAEHENGVLTVRFEKRPEAAGRKIPVSGRATQGVLQGASQGARKSGKQQNAQQGVQQGGPI